MLLNNHLIGKHLLKTSKCASTNTLAMEFLQQSQNVEGWVFITNEQTKGRGQRGNFWEATPFQNFTFSFIVKPTFLFVQQQFSLNFFISLGIYDFLRKKVPSADIKIKWPNDIYVNNLKIGGILIENIIKTKNIDSSIIGIGLNINQVDFETITAQSLRKLTQEKYDLEELIQELLVCLDLRYQQLVNKETKKMKEEYLSNLYWIHENHLFFDVLKSEYFRGNIVGVDDFGQLIIKMSEGQKAFSLKEVQFIE